MKIYFSPTSPYVRKCLVTAHELGLIDKIKLISSNAHPIDRDEKIIALNPLGKVPTLITDEGEVIYDSRVICEFLNFLAGGKLFPQFADKWNILTIQSLGDGILDAALLARYEDVARPTDLRWPQWREKQLDKAETSLRYLNANPETLRNKIHIGTVAVGCALWYLDLRFPDLRWRERYPQVADWYSVFSQRPSMSASWRL